MRGTHSDTVATARTDRAGNYRIDDIPDPRAPAAADECSVSVIGAGSTIQDSRRVYLDPDPSTTTQDLDWRHIPDRHAINGPVTHTTHGAYIKIVAPIPGKPDVLLGQTKPPTCGTKGSTGRFRARREQRVRAAGPPPNCITPIAWRLETIDST